MESAKRVKLALAGLQCGFRALALGDLFRRHVDADDLAARTVHRMPIGNPETFLDLIGALTRDLDAGHRFAGLHDRADDAFDRLGQRRHAVAHRAAQMILHRDAADFGEALVDLQIAAVGRQEREADRRRVIDRLQGRLRETARRKTLSPPPHRDSWSFGNERLPYRYCRVTSNVRSRDQDIIKAERARLCKNGQNRQSTAIRL